MRDCALIATGSHVIYNLNTCIKYLQTKKSTTPCNELQVAAMQKIANEMNVNSRIQFLQTTTNVSYTFGRRFSLIKPVLIMSSEDREAYDFIIRHELAHIRENHHFNKGEPIWVSMLGYSIQLLPINNVFKISLFTILHLLITRKIHRINEKEADLIACQYLTPDGIAQAIHYFDNHRIRQCVESFSISNIVDFLFGETHPSLTERIHYLKNEYYKRSTIASLIRFEIEESIAETLSTEDSLLIRELIKQSDREIILIDVVKIEIFPTKSEDNLIFKTGSNTSCNLTVEMDLLKSYLQDKDPKKIIEIVEKGLENPVYNIIKLKLDDIQNPSVAFDLSAEFKSNLEYSLKEQLKNVCSKEIYNIENLKIKSIDHDCICTVYIPLRKDAG